MFLGKFEEAIDVFNKAIEIDPNEVGLTSLIYIATSFFSLHRYSECLDSCNKALEINPNDSGALKLKQSCLKAMGL